jgi:N-acylneuraminate cytidylyltransferase
MKSLAIIPARGGSKRIPRKNIRDFLGRPIIAYPIIAAKESALFDIVMVSTEDDEIARIAEKYGAQVPFMRSEENANDVVGLTEVCLEVVDRYKGLGRDFDLVCCILPTAPFVTPQRLATAQEMLATGIYHSVFLVMEYGYPIQRSLKMKPPFIEMRWPENFSQRSQDLEKTFHDAGQFYFIKTEALLNEKKLFTSKSGVIILNELDSQDIDTDEDWKIAELKYKMINDREGLS